MISDLLRRFSLEPDHRLTLYGNPYSTNSLYRHGNGISFMTKKGKEIKKSYASDVERQYKGLPIMGDVSIVVLLYIGTKRKCDWDNFHKLAMDSMNKTLLEDDSQILNSLVLKLYDKESPRIEILIYEHK